MDSYFPTIDAENPYELSREEKEVVERLVSAFVSCEKLQKPYTVSAEEGKYV